MQWAVLELEALAYHRVHSGSGDLQYHQDDFDDDLDDRPLPGTRHIMREVLREGRQERASAKQHVMRKKGSARKSKQSLRKGERINDSERVSKTQQARAN